MGGIQLLGYAEEALVPDPLCSSALSLAMWQFQEQPLSFNRPVPFW